MKNLSPKALNKKKKEISAIQNDRPSLYINLLIFSIITVALFPEAALAACTTVGTDTQCTDAVTGPVTVSGTGNLTAAVGTSSGASGTISSTSVGAALAVTNTGNGTIDFTLNQSATTSSVDNQLGSGIALTAQGTGDIRAIVNGTVSSTSAIGVDISSNGGNSDIRVQTGASITGNTGVRVTGLTNSSTTMLVQGSIAAATDFSRAIDLGLGVNSLVLDTGAAITGIIVSNSGTGALTLSGSGASSNYFAGFSSLTVNSTGVWNVDGIFAGSTIAANITSGRLNYASASDLDSASIASGSTLQLGNGGTAGNVTGAISNSGSVIFNRSDSMTYSGAISGTGNLTQAGSGTLILTGNNNHSGGTTISAGTLQVGAGGTTGTITGNITNNSALVFNRSNAMVYDGAVSGTGSVTQAGSGTLSVTGSSTYSGGTTISAGTLSIGNGGTSGSVTGSVINNGILAFNRSDSVAFTGGVSGSGSVIQNGSGLLSLGGINSYTGGTALSAGSLAVTSSTALGSGTLSVNGTRSLFAGADGLSLSNAIALNGNLTVDTGSNAMTLSGVISGAGYGLSKSGTGSMTLSGTSTYTGATQVDAGTLVVNGSIAASSALTIASGATLGGNAQVSNLIVNGTISPGNSVGAITVNGNLTLGSGATTVMELATSSADRITVTGTAALNGTLQLVANAWPYSFGTNYTLLSAQGGTSGSFGSIQTQGAFGTAIRTTLAYTGTDVNLVLAPNALMPILGTTPLTGNQRAIVTAFDRAVLAGGNPTAYFNLFNLPVASIPAASNTLTGEVHTTTTAMGVKASDQFMRAMLDPSATGRTNDATLTTASLPKGEKGPRSLEKGHYTPIETAKMYNLWGATFGQTGKTASNNVIAGSSRRDTSDGNIAFGADFRPFDTTIAGVALSAGSARAALANSLGNAKASVFQAGLYSISRFDAVSLGVAGAYSSVDTDTDRSIPILGVSSVKAKYRADGWSGRIEAAYEALRFAQITISPFGAVQRQAIKTPAFSETNGTTGAPVGLTAFARTNTTARSEVGLKFEATTEVSGSQVVVFAKAGWGHYMARDTGFDANIIGLSGSSFTISGARPSRDTALISIGADTRLSDAFSIRGRLDSEFSGSSRSYSGSAKLNWAF